MAAGVGVEERHVQECVGRHRRVVGAQVCGQPVRGTVSTKAWVWQVCVPMRSS